MKCSKVDSMKAQIIHSTLRLSIMAADALIQTGI